MIRSTRKTATLGTILVAAILLSGWSCSQSQYDRAGQLAQDFAASVLVAQQVEIAAHKTGNIDDATHQAIQRELIQVADAGMKLDAAINQSHNTATAAAEVKVIITLLGDLSQNKLAAIKNEDSKLALQSAILVAQTTIDSIAAFGGAK